MPWRYDKPGAGVAVFGDRLELTIGILWQKKTHTIPLQAVVGVSVEGLGGKTLIVQTAGRSYAVAVGMGAAAKIRERILAAHARCTRMTDDAPRAWRVKHDGVCSRCGRGLLKGMPAVWECSTKSIRCVECPSIDTDQLVESIPFTAGIGGASARQEYDRRMAKRDAMARDKWGNRIGGFVLAVTHAPGTTKAWASGAQGEERLAAALDAMDGIGALHDRRVPGTKGNIDHLVVGPGGVFVVDAKNHKGTVRIRERGGLFRTDLRLYVGSRDWSRLADGLVWQVQAVATVVEHLGLDPKPAITPALCFVEADWPLFRAPSSFGGVRLESLKSLNRVVSSPGPFDGPTIDRVTRHLAREFPPK